MAEHLLVAASPIWSLLLRAARAIHDSEFGNELMSLTDTKMTEDQQIGLQNSPLIRCNNLWVVFGPDADAISGSDTDHRSKEQLLHDTGNVIAVRDVSFEVSPGETFVIMGLSGSGKSTLVRCLSRLIEPTSGEIYISDENLLDMTVSELRELRRHRMSTVFQHFGNFPHKKVIDNVTYGLQVQGVPPRVRRQRAQEVIEIVGLGGWEHRYPQELSGGMQQRVGLARALAVDPEILLFDEPFSALDPLIRRELQDELINLQRRVRKTIVFITHDFLEALKMGDRIAIMKDGEFVQTGTPEEVLISPANEYVRDFTKDVPRYKVLTARSVMSHEFEQGEDLPQDCLTAQIDTTVEELIPLCMSSELPVAIQAANGKIVGRVDRQSLMVVLSGNEEL